jgi:hypothetical protein
MLQLYGICHEPLSPYVFPGPITPVSGHTQSASAISDAALHKLASTNYQRKPGSAAATLLTLLQNNRPVAACFPVFSDPTTPGGPTNWTTSASWLYGRVFDPPLHSVVSGGHCICVTGFEPDATEPSGGYFIFRNSWDTAWASAAPSPGNSASPEQGYGEISATYVDTYCWELLQL